ncbi:MerR family transcriptional regulator [Bradyrhizobium sp. CCBAU 11434]|uniref:MerR family transcriptional regulator n=1 Tax=Bradyrhizobium sp. CCBAU 11434 TaxID=1630885 RepID=UPI00230691D8|nr:MerR family transcriptional regulator [Bradyrhizobium sp. CCBAU 11434]MDA9525473.1 MerR family transcriptional regulator [Bradyrhizobium sp. CCBAU 11434]
MKIGELSRRTGVSVRMLRYYEGEGLLAPQRTNAGYRDYGPEAEETVRRIKMLGSAGMKLETIQQLLPCVRNNDPAFTPCNELRRILAQQVGLIDKRIETLSQSRTILAGYLASVN